MYSCTSVRLDYRNRINFWKIGLFIILLLLNSKVEFAQSDEQIEYKLKAVYIYNFLQFVEWPQSAFDSESSPIVIGILGEDPFGKIMDEAVKSEKIGNHPIIVKRFKLISETNDCHVLYVCASEDRNLKNIFIHVKELPILTISDINDFAEEGGNINFYVDDNKLRFEINVKSLQNAKLKVSSKLLRLAKVINP